MRRQLQLWQGACGLSGPLPEEVVELLDLEELMPRRISDLSGGMAQRVSVGLALLSRPRLLLMDEATTGLDRGYVPRLLDWLEAFVAGGGGLVWCSHHAGELDRLCGAVLTLENGALRKRAAGGRQVLPPLWPDLGSGSGRPAAPERGSACPGLGGPGGK